MKEGDVLPSFKAKNQDDELFSSSDVVDAILYFYPKADTPGCTKEACNFRDNIKKFEKLGMEVYGISTDTVDAQKKFHEKNNLNFTLLADRDGQIADKFNVLNNSGYAERTTFLIVEGKVEKIFRKVDPEQHIEEVLDYL